MTNDQPANPSPVTLWDMKRPPLTTDLELLRGHAMATPEHLGRHMLLLAANEIEDLRRWRNRNASFHPPVDEAALVQWREISRIMADKMTAAEHETNGEFMVRAAENHNDLVAALQDMLDGFDTRAHTDAAHQRRIADRARALITRVKE